MTGTSAVFATARTAGEATTRRFAATTPCTLPDDVAHPAGVDVVGASRPSVASHFDKATGKAVYLVGGASHPTLYGPALLEWCLEAADRDPGRFRDLVGAFVLLIDDRRARRVMLVTDPLGLLPWFVGTSAGRFVSGSDALGICDAGLSAGEVDYDSVASWMCYNFVATGGSVVRDYRRLPDATVSTFELTGQLISQTRYASPVYTNEVVPPEQLVEALHERVSTAFDVLTRGVDEVNLPLSGGYDSRLLCAMAVSRARPRVRVTVVESTPAEAAVARRVAETLKLPLHAIPVERSVVDLFDDPLYFMPEGFPVARNLTNAVARLHPGVPVLSGFIGDALMRGPVNAAVKQFLAKDFENLSDDELARAADERFRIRTNRLHLLRDPIAPRVRARGMASLLPVIRGGREAGRPLAFANLYLRHRLYFAGIFLSHLDVADALLPFASWDLVAYHAAHARSFDADTYARLFRRYYPALADVPHDSELKDFPPAAPVPKAAKASRHARRWVRELLSGLASGSGASALNPRKVLKRVPGALLGKPLHADEIGYLHRVQAFERRLRQSNIGLDWSAV